MRKLRRAVGGIGVTILLGTSLLGGCAPTKRTPLGGTWVEEWQGPVLPEAGGHRFRLLRKRLLGYGVVDQFISRPHYYKDGDCVVYEQLDAREIRVVCGDREPRALIVGENRFGGEMPWAWDIDASGLRRKLREGQAQADCIPLAAVKRAAEGGAVVVVPCPSAAASSVAGAGR